MGMGKSGKVFNISVDDLVFQWMGVTSACPGGVMRTESSRCHCRRVRHLRRTWRARLASKRRPSDPTHRPREDRLVEEQ